MKWKHLCNIRGTSNIYNVRESFACFRLAGSYEALEKGNPVDVFGNIAASFAETIDLVEEGYGKDLEKRRTLHKKLTYLMKQLSPSNIRSSSIIRVFFTFI